MNTLKLTRPSNLERRALCPGSDREESKCPPREAGERAERGTRIHAHLEELIKAGAKRRPALLKKKENGSEEERIGVQGYRSLVELAEAFFSPDDEVAYHSEKELSLEAFGFDNPAHVDVAVVGKELCLIADLKSGEWPYAPDSWQMKAYALAAWEEWQSSEFVLAIIQPESENPVRWVKVDAKTLAGWAAQVEAVLDEARKPDAPVKPSDNACKWCAAVGSCPAYKGNELKRAEPTLATLDFKNLSLPEYVRLASPAHRAELMESAERMAKWLDNLNGELQLAAEEGLAVEGYELRSAKMDKVWKDEALVIPVLLALCQKNGKDQAAVRQPLKWVSPAQALKLFPESKELDEHITLKPSKPSLKRVR